MPVLVDYYKYLTSIYTSDKIVITGGEITVDTAGQSTIEMSWPILMTIL